MICLWNERQILLFLKNNLFRYNYRYNVIDTILFELGDLFADVIKNGSLEFLHFI